MEKNNLMNINYTFVETLQPEEHRGNELNVSCNTIIDPFNSKISDSPMKYPYPQVPLDNPFISTPTFSGGFGSSFGPTFNSQPPFSNPVRRQQPTIGEDTMVVHISKENASAIKKKMNSIIDNPDVYPNDKNRLNELYSTVNMIENDYSGRSKMGDIIYDKEYADALSIIEGKCGEVLEKIRVEKEAKRNKYRQYQQPKQPIPTPVVVEEIKQESFIYREPPIKPLPDLINLQGLDFAKNQSAVIGFLFTEMRDDSFVHGKLSPWGVTLKDLKSINYGEEMIDVFDKAYKLAYGGGNLSEPVSKQQLRELLIDCAAERLKTYKEPLRVSSYGTAHLTNKDKLDPRLTETLAYFERYANNCGKMVFSDYEIRFTVIYDIMPKSDDDMVIFLDNEGNVSSIRPMNIDRPKNSENGIYVNKMTPENDDKKFVRYALPPEDDPLPIETLNGVFFRTYSSFSKKYLSMYGIDYKRCTEHERKRNIKNMLGRLLYGGVSDGSHGIFPHCTGYSLSRKYFYYSTESEVREVINVTPDEVGKDEFDSILSEVGLSRNLLEQHDYIIRKVQIGPGSVLSPRTTDRYDKIKVGKKTGLNNLKSDILDEDIKLVLETGMAVFATREAAERCIKYAKGDIVKYIEYITNKTSNKDEKRKFIDNIKSTLLLGVGAAIPKVIEMIININTEKKPSSDTSSGDGGKKNRIMKPMLPPFVRNIDSTTISAGAAATTWLGSLGTMSTGAVSAYSGVVGATTSSIMLTSAGIAGAVWIAWKVYNEFGIKKNRERNMEAIKNFFNGASKAIKTAAGAAENATFGETIAAGFKTIVTGIGNFFVGIKDTIVNTGKYIWDNMKQIGNLEGDNILEKGVSLVKNIGMFGWNMLKGIGTWVAERATDAWGFITGFFTKKPEVHTPEPSMPEPIMA